MLFDRQRDISALRQRENPSRHAVPVDFHPARKGLILIGGDERLHVFALGRTFPEPDDIPRAHLERGGVDLMIVDDEMAMGDELAGMRPRTRETHQTDGVVKPPFQHTEQVLARDAFLALGSLEEQMELFLGHAVVSFHFLFFTKLDGIAQNPLPGTSMLSRREGPPLHRTLVGQAFMSLEKQLGFFHSAESAIRDLKSSHDCLLISSSPSDSSSPADAASVVRNRRNVLDRFDFQAGRLHGADGRFPSGSGPGDPDIDVADSVILRFDRRILGGELGLRTAFPLRGALEPPRFRRSPNRPRCRCGR